MASAGLLKGIGGALSMAGASLFEHELDKAKQDRLEKYRLANRLIAEAGATNRALMSLNADAQMEEGRRNFNVQWTPTREEVISEGGKNWLVQYNKFGEEILRKEILPESPQEPVGAAAGPGTKDLINIYKELAQQRADGVLSKEGDAIMRQIESILGSALGANLDVTPKVEVTEKHIDEAKQIVNGRFFGLLGGMDNDVIQKTFGGDRNAAINYIANNLARQEQGLDPLPPSHFVGGGANDPNELGLRPDRINSIIEIVSKQKRQNRPVEGAEGEQEVSESGPASLFAEVDGGERKGKSLKGLLRSAHSFVRDATDQAMIRDLERLEKAVRAGTKFDNSILARLDAIYRNQDLPEEIRMRAREAFLEAVKKQ